MICFLLLLQTSVAHAMPAPAASLEEIDARVGKIKKMAPYREWRHLGTFGLGGPDLDTGHPQGLVMKGDQLIVSTQKRAVGSLHFYSVKRVNELVAEVAPVGEMSFSNSRLRHPGGLHLSSAEEIFVPLSGPGRGDGTQFLKVTAGHASEAAVFGRADFHLGAFLLDPFGKFLHAIGFTNEVYTFDLALLPPDVSTNPEPFRPRSRTEYQDCKSLGGFGYFLCSGKNGGGLGSIRGTLDLVRVLENGTISEQETFRIPVPLVFEDGSFGAESGTYIPGVTGIPPLTYNPFDFELSSDDSRIRLYFAPFDGPRTNLFVYEAVFRD